MRDLTRNTQDIIVQRRNYFRMMADMCDEVLDGKYMTEVCREHGVSLATFRGRLFNNEQKPNLFTQDALILSIEECLTPEERILRDVAKPYTIKFKPTASIEYAEDFEETINNLIEEFPNQRMKEIFRLYYYEQKTLEEICSIYDITTSRVGQIVNKGVLHLKRRDRIVRMIIGDTKYRQYVEKIDKPGYAEQAIDEVMRALEFSTTFGEMCDMITSKIKALKEEYKLRLDSEIPGQISIDTLGLDVRTYNSIFRSSNIRTVDQLAQTPDEDLMRIRNFGRKCLDNVKECLVAHGYTKV